jgi:hypothetical protein
MTATGFTAGEEERRGDAIQASWSCSSGSGGSGETPALRATSSKRFGETDFIFRRLKTNKNYLERVVTSP